MLLVKSRTARCWLFLRMHLHLVQMWGIICTLQSDSTCIRKGICPYFNQQFSLVETSIHFHLSIHTRFGPERSPRDMLNQIISWMSWSFWSVQATLSYLTGFCCWDWMGPIETNWTTMELLTPPRCASPVFVERITHYWCCVWEYVVPRRNWQYLFLSSLPWNSSQDIIVYQTTGSAPVPLEIALKGLNESPSAMSSEQWG